jgi:uncharacterized delta-60 repeat protein
MHRVAALVVSGVVAAQAAPGGLDPTFGTGGKVTTRIGADAVVRALALQPDGKIVVAGWSKLGSRYDFTLARYNGRGSLDRTFGSRGVVRTALGDSSWALAAVIQPDGRIVAAGYAVQASRNRFALARYNRDGSLDRRFGTGGRLTTAFPVSAIGGAVLLQPDGKIVVAGSVTRAGFALVRYRRGGSIDRSFGDSGRVTTTFGADTRGFASALTLQPDGRIVAAGTTGEHETSEIALARYRRDGALDPTFGAGGKATALRAALTNNFAAAVRLQRGKIVVAGGANADFALLRFRADGSLDPSFGTDGPGTTLTPIGHGATAYGLSIQRDGKYVLAGSAVGSRKQVVALARFGRNGAPDNSFASTPGATVTTTITNGDDIAYGIALRRDGKIVVAGAGNENGAGSARFALARFLAATRH